MPQRTNAWHPSPPGAPNTLRSGEIYGAGVRSTHLWRDPWRWRGGVLGEWATLLYPGTAPFLPPMAPSHLGDRPPPTPTVMALLAPHPPPSPPSQARY
jgi:hypothetical protein